MEKSGNPYVIKSILTEDNFPITPASLPNLQNRTPLGSGVITRILGHGGMATVYEIWNSQLEIFRAVKIMNPNAEDLAHERFQTEIKISAKLNHPNIVEIHSVGEWQGLPYIEMEKIEGIGLDYLIKQRGALPADICIAIGIMIGRALKYAHSQDCAIYGKSYHGVIHRDLKPANIMICTNGIVKLMDFGIARPPDVSFHTMDGFLMGTLQYLAPELLERKKLDARTDIYSLGVTMYEIITGVNAFPQENFPELMAVKNKNKFRMLDEYHGHIPQSLKRIIHKCMEYVPEKRIASAEDLLDELEKLFKEVADKSPEEIIADVSAMTVGEKVVLESKKVFPRNPAILVALLAVTGIFLISISLVGHKSQHEKSAPPVQITESKIQVQHPKQIENNVVAEKQKKGDIKTATKKGTVSERKSIPDTESKKAGLEKTAVAHAASGSLTPENMLLGKYPAEDRVDGMEKELKDRNYENVLLLFNNLSPAQAMSDRAIILKLRALDIIGNAVEFARTVGGASVNDGEFVLQKARVLYRSRNFAECRALCKKSLSLPHAYLDYDNLKREACYYTALCATAQFDADPTSLTYKAALDEWWQLRNTLQDKPDHQYNRKAELELQRMAQKMHKG